jgi:hypothetical protein
VYFRFVIYLLTGHNTNLKGRQDYEPSVYKYKVSYDNSTR